MRKRIKCEFTSVWDDGSEVTTPCFYNEKTGEVTPEVSKGNPPTGSLEREYITLENEDELEVCRDCHGFVLKSVMQSGPFHAYDEVEVCSDPGCESNDQEAEQA
jgi:hypothetical protein